MAALRSWRSTRTLVVPVLLLALLRPPADPLPSTTVGAELPDQ
jgi:hypothetical protein